MKLKKTFSFTDKNQIWRLLIDEADHLIVETRDTDDKEVFFHCMELGSGKKIFNKFQLEEKFWIGIETIFNGKIYFHHFAKPNMPEHKQIIAYDYLKNEMVWQNADLTFLSINDGKLFAFMKKFEGHELFLLDPENGEVIEELGSDQNKLNDIINYSKFNEDYSDYIYPENPIFSENNIESQIINKEINRKNEVNNVQSLKVGEFLCFNYYHKTKNNLLDNEFTVYNIEKKKKVISETLNKNLNSYSPDSFFVYKNYLLVLKNKKEIILYKIS